MKTSRVALLSLLVGLLVISSAISVNATEHFTLDNWDVYSVWHGDVFDESYTNFTWSVNFGSVKLNNATNTGKFAFSVIQGSSVNTGYAVEIYVGAQGANYLSKDNL
jgi:hypothetical protein